jgi:hypothetical protein
VTEAQLLEAVIDAAHFYGWRVAHFRPAKTERGWRTPVQADGKGWPDLTLVRERVVFAELKTARGLVSAEQEDWLAALARAGAELYLWREGDWIDGTVERALRRRDPDAFARLAAATSGDRTQAHRVQADVDRSRWFGR